MEYLKFLLIMVLDLFTSLGLSYGLFRYLTSDIGNSTGDMGMGFAAVIFSVIAFLILVVVVGFILFSIIM